MKYFIDTSEISEIKKWKEKLGNSFAGVTTNLTMLKNLDEKIEFVNSIRKFYIPVVMIQIEDENEARKIAETGNYIIKIPMVEKNFELINYSKTISFTAATTCYDIIQINQAIEMNMDYSMVYYHKNPYKGLLTDSIKLKSALNSDIKLVAASIRNVDDVKTAIMSGIEFATVKASVLENIFNNENALRDLNEQ